MDYLDHIRDHDILKQIEEKEKREQLKEELDREISLLYFSEHMDLHERDEIGYSETRHLNNAKRLYKQLYGGEGRSD